MGESFEVASEVEHLAARIIDRSTRERFLKGFEAAIKDSQEKNPAKPMHEHLKKGLNDPYNFGVHLGYLIGFLRFHPRQILESNETASHFLESVNHLKEFNDFHSFAKEKLQSWNRKIRPNFKELEEAEKRVYMTVMRMI